MRRRTRRAMTRPKSIRSSSISRLVRSVTKENNATMKNTIRSLKLKRLSLFTSIALALAISLLASGVALAHESRIVGKYKLVVGFVNEPALNGQPNAIDFRVTVSDTAKAVEGLDKTVKAEVIYGGGKSMPVALSARFGQPGAYAGYFIPTRPGTYIFHFTGQIE